MSLGLEIKAELVRQGRTMDQLAEAIGISRGNLSSKINNHADFRYSELMRVGIFLSIPASELTRRAEEAARNGTKKGRTK